MVSGEDGTYLLSTNNNKLNQVEFSYAVYKKITGNMIPVKEISVDIQLEQPIMNEVVVKTMRGKYRNKDNPAVELIRKVIDKKDKNRMTACDFVLYQQFEKIELSLTNKPEKLLKKTLLK